MSLIIDCFRRLTEPSSYKSELKGYKVTDVNRTRKFGIACRNLQDLKRKACSKLNVTNDPAEVNVFLLDGSLIDEEYFHTLEPQTTLILQKPGEKVLSEYLGNTLFCKYNVSLSRYIPNMHCEFGQAPKLNIPVNVNLWKFVNFLAIPNAPRGKVVLSPTRAKMPCSFFLKGKRFPADADILYDVLRRVNIDFLTVGDKVAQFLTENLKAKVAVLNNVLNKDNSKMALSTRDEHPEWFKDLETNYMTKEVYMHRRCQDRIRNYLYKTIEQIKCSDVYMNDRKARQQLLRAIAFFKIQLKEDHYFGYYFDRSRAKTDSKDDTDETDSDRCYEHCPCQLRRISDERCLQSSDTNETDDATEIDETDAKKFIESGKNAKTANDEEPESCPYRVKSCGRHEQIAICDNKGEFRCEGRWNADGCTYGDRHKINPYRSREELVLFSTWNLDHKIERSRTLVPRLLQISLQDTINEKDIYDCYDNLFTVKNLKLVHIVCHDKGSHK